MLKAIIYLRTSTREQNPELQKQECLDYANNKGYEVLEIYEEQLSGYKDIIRPKYEAIKEKARIGQINAVIVWAFDRWVRNRDTLLEDVTTLRNYGVKLHSVKDNWLELINIEGSLGKTIQEFLLGLIGCLAEMESQRKSERVKLAYDKYEKTNWGRHSLSPEINNLIVESFKTGKSLRQISKDVFYWDKNRNKKYVSLGYVHKIVSKFKKGETFVK